MTPGLAIFSPAGWAALLALAVGVGLALANTWYHRVVVMNTAETDAYFLRADDLLRLGVYTDQYRPPLFTVLTAALAWATGLSTFLSASLIASAATAWLVLNTYLIARAFVSGRYALLAAALVAADHLTVQYGLVGTTDALFAALSTGLLLLAVRFSSGAGISAAQAKMPSSSGDGRSMADGSAIVNRQSSIAAGTSTRQQKSLSSSDDGRWTADGSTIVYRPSSIVSETRYELQESGTSYELRGSWKGLVARSLPLGALLGLVYLTRYVAAPLALVVALAVWQADAPVGTRLRCAGVIAAAAFVVTLPWLIYNTRVNGGPFANDNWRNFAFAIYGQGDYNYLRNNPFTGYLDVFMHDPGRVVAFWGASAARLAYKLPAELCSSPLLALFLPFGLVELVRSRSGRLPMVYALALIVPVALTFVYQTRLFLAVTPVLMLIAVVGLAGIGRRWPRLRLACAAVAVAALALALRTLPATASEFQQNQPTTEVAMLNQLVRAQGATAARPLRVISTYKYAASFVEPPGAVEQYHVAWYDRRFPALLLDTVAAQRADYILISDLTAGGALRAGRLDGALPRCWALQQEAAISVGAARLYKNECPAT